MAISAGAVSRALRLTTLLPLALLLFLAAGPILILGRRRLARTVWLAAIGVYVVAVLASGTIAALRFRELRVGALTVVGLVARHIVYAAGLVTGLRRPAVKLLHPQLA